jgi:hypothetical protein
VAGNPPDMPTLNVLPRPTPEERHDRAVEIEVDEELTVLATTIEEWVAPRQGWELTLHEGHDFGRPNNIEARLVFASGDQTSSLSFRLDQLDTAGDDLYDLVLRFEEADGIAKTARLTPNGLEVDLHHILTVT